MTERLKPSDEPTQLLDGRSDPTPRPAPAAEPLPERVGCHDIRGELGRGGMGVVLDAHDVELRRDVAIKMLAGPTDDDAVRRFVSEARIAGRLEHPNLVPVYQLGSASDRVWF